MDLATDVVGIARDDRSDRPPYRPQRYYHVHRSPARRPAGRRRPASRTDRTGGPDRAEAAEVRPSPSPALPRTARTITRRGWIFSFIDPPNRTPLRPRVAPSTRRVLTVAACCSSNRVIKKRNLPEKASSVKGVNYDKHTSKWLVRVSENGKQRYFGRYPTQEAAEAAARDHKASTAAAGGAPLAPGAAAPTAAPTAPAPPAAASAPPVVQPPAQAVVPEQHVGAIPPV